MKVTVNMGVNTMHFEQMGRYLVRTDKPYYSFYFKRHSDMMDWIEERGKHDPVTIEY